MDYPYENLDDQKFQAFCQSLLSREFSGIQCFPIAQPDGGRDALLWLDVLGSNEPEEFIVFQVKFKRNPKAETDPHKWLREIVEGEAPKIKKLMPKGAKRFILITNVSGTAHPETGSIDRVQKIFQNCLDIPAICYWRDDLNRRLDDAFDLKWSYPELMTGVDFIRTVVETQLTEQQQRRSNAIRSFIKDQFCTDQLVRFKQVELQNRLFDLFIDVPISPPHSATNRKKHFHYRQIYDLVLHATQKERRQGNVDSFDTEIIGAATLILHSVMQKEVPWLVLEGAPGQGKSTITQYICQVHRIRLLDSQEILRNIPEEHRHNEVEENLPELHKSSPIKIPIRVDLRDFAAWLAKKNPFSLDSQDEVPADWSSSLESFLAALIQSQSGGTSFNVADLIAIAKISPLLIVLDGLDEVADITRRQDVVREIMRGANRLVEHDKSLQVIVTSRPAAFANSPGLPEDKFPYYQLESVTRNLVNEYADKWLRARKLQGKESAEVKKILRQKLDQPHLRDLAKNPMQLAILLSLIHTRGSSLPDKRTALYDKYVELFLNRESEKNPVVREHRELLIEIHRYLAWILHSEAEQKGGDGSITEERLISILESYLSKEGHSTSIVQDLSLGIRERVAALVSRVQGTYEFEVQPLREYFAARHLYETAPYSPSGQETSGTKPDRFDAIARNFYWLNVARFYAGCYSKGELPSLIDRLQELISSEGYALISHPRMLASTLLSDWVFTQHPKSVQAVISLIIDGIGLRYLLPSTSRRLGQGNPMILPKGCGKDELINHCFSVLANEPARDYALDLIDLIRVNASLEEIQKMWFGGVITQKGIARTQWLEYGLYLGVLSQIALTSLREALSDIPLDNDRINLLLRARRYDFVDSDENIFEYSVTFILSKHVSFDGRRNSKHILDLFRGSLNAFRYGISFHNPHKWPLNKVWSRGYLDGIGRMSVDSLDHYEDVNYPAHDASNKILTFLKVAHEQSLVSASEWATSVEPWNVLVEKGREEWGDHWVFFHIANVSGGIKSKTETYSDFSDLLDHSLPLCKRARYARLRAGSSNWWVNQLLQAESDADLAFALLVFVTWAGAKTLSKLTERIDSLLENLPHDIWMNLCNSLDESVSAIYRGEQSVNLDLDNLPKHLHSRTAVLLSKRTGLRTSVKLYKEFLSNYSGDDHLILSHCQGIALGLLGRQKIEWDDAQRIIQKSYLQGALSERYAFQQFSRRSSDNPLPHDIAVEIAKSPELYPNFLVAAAEIKCRSALAQNITPVGVIAKQEGWFD